MELLRKHRAMISVIFFGIFLAYSLHPVQASFSDQYRKPGNEAGISRVVSAYTSVHLTLPGSESSHFPVVPVSKICFINSFYTDPGKSQTVLNSGGITQQSPCAGRPVLLDMICRLQI